MKQTTDWLTPVARFQWQKPSYPNTGGSQFFIIPEDSTPNWLDGVHTVFGTVTSGCEHITTISEVATGQGDRPVYSVTIS